MALTSIDFTNALQSVLPTVCGVPESALNGVSPRYVVCITATLGTSMWNTATQTTSIQANTGKKEFTVNAFLQEKIVLSVSSDWQGVTQDIPGADVFNAADTLTQAFLSKTLISTLSQRRKWAGSSPISIRMKLRFEAFKDPYTEVVVPCIGLQGLVLPSGGIGNTIFLTPPGPNPFDLTLKGDADTALTENIEVNIGGGFLDFTSVIIKDVQVTFENRMGVRGPIGADVDLGIETYQMLTREDLMKVAHCTGQVTGNLGNAAPSATPTTM